MGIVTFPIDQESKPTKGFKNDNIFLSAKIFKNFIVNC